MNGGALINRQELIELLEATIEEVKRGASFEGRLQYTCMLDECDSGAFAVRAFVRTGNDMGQGGCMVVDGDIMMDAPPPTVHEQVLEFHRKVGQPIVEKPAVPSDERVRLRARLVLEESLEFLEALFGVPSWIEGVRHSINYAIDRAPVKVDLPKAVDALADIDYVVEGSRIEFGVDGGPIAREVHRANMEKQGGPRREDGKVLKPPGWKPPDIDGELDRQGYEP